MALLINSGNFPEPNEFSQTPSVIGGFHQTLAGTQRRDKIGNSESFNLGWNQLPVSNYNTIRAAYEAGGTVSFQWSDLGITEMEAHVDMNQRTVIAGTNQISNVSITLRRVQPL